MWYFFVDTKSEICHQSPRPERQATDLRASAGSDFLALALCFTQRVGDIFKQPRNAKTTERKLGKSLTKVLPDDRRSSLIVCDD
jgi:hypothetical protein